MSPGPKLLRDEPPAWWTGDPDESELADASLMTPAERAEIERVIQLNEIRRNVDRSFEQDPERARLSYTEHTATALRRRVLAAANGQAAALAGKPRLAAYGASAFGRP